MSEIGEAVAFILPKIIKLVADQVAEPKDQALAMEMIADQLKLRASMQADLDKRHKERDK